MGSKSYKIKEEFKLHFTEFTNLRRAIDLLQVSYEALKDRGIPQDILDFKASRHRIGHDGPFKVYLEYKKVVSSKTNQVCFLGLLLDLDTGDFIFSDRKKETYFSAFNIFKFLESYGIFITPEVLKYNIEQYKFNQITLEELLNNFQESSELAGSITSRYLSKDADIVDTRFSLERFLETFILLSRVFWLGLILDVPLISSEFVEGVSNEDTKVFMSDIKNVTYDCYDARRLFTALRDSALGGQSLTQEDIEEVAAQLTTGAHFNMAMDVSDMREIKDLTPRKIRYALNLKDVLENDPEGTMYLDEMFMGDIDSKELVDRIGLRDYVKGRFAGYSAQGFVHGKYEGQIRRASYTADKASFGRISPEGEGAYTSTQAFVLSADEGVLMGYVNASFRKLQRALRRMERAT